MRIWAILFIVAHHSIHIYWYWPVNSDIPALAPLYMLNFSTILKNIGLAIFTYISGMLVFYQAQKKTTLLNFVNKKIRRLLLPALIWGIVYHILFPNYESNKIPTFINGNHLWYLLMLFTCMLSSIPLILKLKYRWFIVIGIYLTITLCSHLNWTFIEFRSYFPIFIMGYIFSYLKEKKISFSPKVYHICLFTSVFFIFLYTEISLTNSLLSLSFYIIYMAAICYVTSYIFIKIKIHNPKKITILLNNNTFIIYLLHQFIINILIKNNLLLNYNLWYYNMGICFLTGIIIPMSLGLIINKLSTFFIYKKIL